MPIEIRRGPDYEAARKHVVKMREKSLEQHRKALAHHQPKKRINWWKWLGILALIGLAAWLWNRFDIVGLFLNLMEQNPHVWAAYQAISSEVAARSLLGLFYASFFGGLFFLSIPVEVVFLYYLGLNYYVVQVVTIVLVGNILGMIFNYASGRLIGERVVKYFMKDSYPKFRKKLDRAGAFIILLGNIIPFPIEPFSVFLGAVKYRFSWFMIYTIIGKIIKFILLALGYFYFLKYAAPYLDTISVDWFVQSIRSVFIFW